MTTDDYTLLEETIGRFAAQPAADFSEDWAQAVVLGLPYLLLSSDQGGIDGGWSALFVLQFAAGLNGSPLPLGEAAVANWLADAAGFETDGSFGGLALRMTGGVYPDGAFTGAASQVARGSHARWVIGIDTGGRLVRLDIADGTPLAGVDLMGQNRDGWRFDRTRCHSGPAPADAMLIAAILRIGQMAGATAACLKLTTEHVRTRVQFGRPIAEFQAVQQQLATFAIEAGAAECAARAACASADRRGLSEATHAIAAAKLRINMAADIATATAHQLHGAIGITDEHPLGRFTRLLWAWRSEGGNDRYWARRLGAEIAAAGADRLWSNIVEA